jgi:uncharacterized protein
MTRPAEYVAGITTHTRRGAIRHSFRYGVDFVLFDPEPASCGPALFSRNRFNVASVYDVDHGGPLKAGRGAVWARQVLKTHGLEPAGVSLQLLAQPRFFGQVFSPVSFWFAIRRGALLAVIAEVSTPFGDRHSYLCRQPDFAPITDKTQITAPKTLHVSPFQDVAGTYQFVFDIRDDHIAIRILHNNGDEGVVASLSGPRTTLTNGALIKASLRRPLGGLRTSGLIYWQALRLKLKGARYRTRPAPPVDEVT